MLYRTYGFVIPGNIYHDYVYVTIKGESFTLNDQYFKMCYAYSFALRTSKEGQAEIENSGFDTSFYCDSKFKRKAQKLNGNSNKMNLIDENSKVCNLSFKRENIFFSKSILIKIKDAREKIF